MGIVVFLGGLISLIFFIAIIILIIWAVAQIGRRNGTGSFWGGVSRQPIDIARERYAKGEISHEEFEQIKKDLS